MKINLRLRNGRLTPADEEARELLDTFQDADYVQIDIKNMDKRTVLQNSSLHLWCKQIADHLNKEDLTITDVIKAETQWNMNTVKENVFKPVVKSLYGKDSTTKLNRNEFEKIIDTMVLAFASKGIVIPDFPNRDKL